MKSLKDVLMNRTGSKASKDDGLINFRLSIEATDKFWRLDSSGYVYADTSQTDAEQMPNTVFGLGDLNDEPAGYGEACWGLTGTTPDGESVWFAFTLEGGYLCAYPLGVWQMSVEPLGRDGPNTYVAWNNSYLEWTSDGRIKLGGTEKNDYNNFYIKYCI
jgi:hypothetical protein